MQETLERCRLGAEAAFSSKPDPFTAKDAKGR